MDTDKFASIQVQMQQNNKEYQTFLNDLDSWETDVKLKEEKLKEKPGENALPPVRNSLEQKKKKKKKKPKPIDSSQKDEPGKKKKIRGFDYHAWDKFDVDAACEEVDEEKDHHSSEDEYETDEEWEMERMKLLAVQHKEQGNQFFKDGDNINAVECYTRGIECDPENPVLPANRAMALIKQEKYAVAELDCTRSLTLDPAYIKAFQRRGTARAALKKYSEAKSDFMEVLKKEPKNKQAKSELEKVERLLNPPKLLQSKNLDASDIGIVKAVYKPPDQRSQKPLKRIIIEEIGEEEKEIRRKERMQSAQASQSETAKLITAQDNALFDKLIQDENVWANQGATITEIHEDVNNEHNNVTGGIVELNIKDTKESKTVASSSVLGKSNKTGDVKIQSDKIKFTQMNGEHKETGSCESSPRVPPVPTSSYQFQADWKTLKNSSDQFYQYFKEIEPANFSKLFGQFLDADVLTKVFSTLKSYYIPNSIDPYPVLLSLCDVKRFTMTVMFMSSMDKQVLKEVFSYMQQQDKHGKDHLLKLSTKYNL